MYLPVMIALNSLAGAAPVMDLHTFININGEVVEGAEE